MRNIKVISLLPFFMVGYLLAIIPCNTHAIDNQKQAPSLAAQLPDGDIWLEYFKNSLMPFYFSQAAFGEPHGNFPSWRCNNGQVYNPDDPCKELVSSYKNQESIISKSRQTYFYGVAYHLTGDENALVLAKAGVDYIRKFAIDPKTGSIATYIKNGLALPAPEYRTALQLAYGTLGMAFYYYLTRDAVVLNDIVKLKNYLFEHYYSKESGVFMWLPVGTEVDENDPDLGHLKQGERLSSQLDQLSTYLLLLTPIVPDSMRAEWKNDLVKLADILIDKFYDETNTRFNFIISELSEKEKNNPALKPNFGRTIKAFWMIYFIAKMTDNLKMLEWVETNAVKVLEKAYIERTGSWGFRLLENGDIDENKLTWIYIELEMMTATLAVKDNSLIRYLIKTNKFWFDHIVDMQHHEIWSWLTPDGDVNHKYPKMFFYKKGFHSAEHALVGYITAQAIHDKPVVLYYAFDKNSDNNKTFPYFYSAQLRKQEIEYLQNFECLNKLKVTFSQVH